MICVKEKGLPAIWLKVDFLLMMGGNKSLIVCLIVLRACASMSKFVIVRHLTVPYFGTDLIREHRLTSAPPPFVVSISVSSRFRIGVM